MSSSAETDQKPLSPAAADILQQIAEVKFKPDLRVFAPKFGELVLRRHISPEEVTILGDALSARKRELTATHEELMPPEVPETFAPLTVVPPVSPDVPRVPDWAERALPRGDREL